VAGANAPDSAPLLAKPNQCGPSDRVNLDVPGLTMLAQGNGDNAALEINVLPTQAVLLASAHPSVEG